MIIVAKARSSESNLWTIGLCFALFDNHDSDFKQKVDSLDTKHGFYSIDRMKMATSSSRS
jgi:hypothetical protein